jgi:kynurenine formamidase
VAKGRLIDLTRVHHTGMPVYPVLARTFLQRYTAFDDWAGTAKWPSSTDLWVTSTHAGTHMDASAHMAPGTDTIDRVDLDLMWGDALRLDVSGLAPGEEVSLERARSALGRTGEALEPRLIVLFHTGMSAYWDDPIYRQSTIGISPEVVRWLLDEGVLVYGLDASSPDVDFDAMPNHQLLGARPHHQIENLVNLDQIPTARFTFLGFPLPLRDATASPIRALALVDT